MLELRKLWTRVGSLNYRPWAFWMLASLWTVVPLQGQIGGGGQVSCNTGVSVTPTLRGEGYTELAGEIHFVCSGGSALPVGSALPLLNFTIFLNTAVTSRLLPVANGDNISEALLILDEPGSGLASPPGPFGANAPQTICPTPTIGCIEYISTVAGIPVATNTLQGANATVAGYNVFQGVVSVNSVTFYGVPLLTGLDGLTHVYRVSNLRANATSLAGASTTPLVASISISGASMLIGNPVLNVGFVQTGLSVSASAAPNFAQCSSQTATSVTTLSFNENFGTVFRTRVLAQTNTSYAGQTPPGASANNPPQNVPGFVYFTESGFVIGGTAGGQTAGLADFGTRLKAQFNNVPAGVRLFVSVSNVLNNAMPFPPPAVPGGGAANLGTTGFAQLIPSESGAFSVVPATDSAPGNSGSVPVTELPVVNGSAMAVWEVVNTNPNAMESLKFAVYTTYTANPGQNSPPPGTATVNLSFAPTPPAFSASLGAYASDTLPVPRFVSDTNSARYILNIVISACASLSVSKTHSGSFAPGQPAATYTVTVSNGASPGPTSGTVTVTETVPAGLTLVTMAGPGWTCPSGGNTCTRLDPLPAGSSYPSITVFVNVAAQATSPQVNSVSVSGGGSATASATDSTTIMAAPVVTSDSVSPSSGSTTNATLTAVYSDSVGYANLGYAHLLINTGVDGSRACYVAYQRSSNTLILLNDAGNSWLGPIPAGSAGTLQNSQCVLSGVGSSATGSGNSLNFTASLSFKPSFAGSKTVFLYADGAGGVNSGWQSRGAWTVPTNLVRTADSVSPSSGNTANATLMAVYSDTTGYANLGYVHLLINSGLAASNACYVAYQRSSNTLILLNDAGNGWLGPITAGPAGTLQNGQCVLNGIGSSATGSGNSLNFTASLSFKSSFAGSKTVFLYADGGGGINSGWQSRGTWTVPGSEVITADSITPASGNTANAIWTAVYGHSLGFTNLGYVHLLINSGLSATNACYVAYQRSGNTLILLNDAGSGWLGPITAGSAGTLQNSQCVLNGTGSSATGSGNSLSFTASLSFKSSFAGSKTVFLYADGAGGINSGWQSRGTWTVPGSEVLTADSVAPASGNTVNATLTAVYSDTAGYANLGYAHLLINAGLSASNACYVAYQRSSNSLILLNDAGTGWLGPITAGSGVTLQNSQCVLNASGSSATGSGSNLTLTVSLTFKPSFTGSKTVFLYTDGSGGLNSAWQSRGTWTVP